MNLNDLKDVLKNIDITKESSSFDKKECKSDLMAMAQEMDERCAEVAKKVVEFISEESKTSKEPENFPAFFATVGVKVHRALIEGVARTLDRLEEDKFKRTLAATVITLQIKKFSSEIEEILKILHK